MTTGQPAEASAPMPPSGKRREQVKRAIRARAGRFRIVAWILVLLLPVLIVSLLSR
jgi:hypothetical protein